MNGLHKKTPDYETDLIGKSRTGIYDGSVIPDQGVILFKYCIDLTT